MIALSEKKRTIIAYNEETPLVMSRASKFGSKQLDGSLPNESIISLIPYVLSNLATAGRCPVELVSAVLSQPIKKTNINDCNQSIVSVIRGLTPRTGRQTYWN